MNRIRSMATLAALFVGCTSSKRPSDTAEADTGSTADDITDPVELTTMAFASTDYTVTSLSTLALATRTLSDNVAALPGDAVVKRLPDGRIYNLNRYGYDVVRAYTPGSWASPVFEVSVGDGTANPHDIVLCNDELWLSLYGSNSLLVMNPDTGSVVGAVDLSEYAQGDAIAEFDALYCREDRIVAVAQQLDPVNYLSEGGTIVVVDAETKSAVNAFDVRPNPKTHPHPTDDNALIVFSGHYGDGDGAITTVNLTTGVESDPLAVEADHGVTFSGFAAHDGRAVVMGTNFDYTATKVLCADLATWALTDAFTIGAYTGSIAGGPDGTAWIGLPTRYTEDEPGIEAPPGLQAFDIANCVRDGAPIETTLAPSSMTFY